MKILFLIFILFSIDSPAGVLPAKFPVGIDLKCSSVEYIKPRGRVLRCIDDKSVCYVDTLMNEFLCHPKGDL